MIDPRTRPQEDVLIDGQHNYETITDRVGSVVLDQAKYHPLNKKHGRPWTALLITGFVFLNVLMLAIGWLLYQGIGIWGNNQPAGWGFDIINFVWWIGIGHAGTLISAVLLLMRQKWRMSINRFAEAMTIFAVMCAGLFPLLHTGRPWVAYWLFPYPNWLGMWPNFRSPLVWDVFAVSTYMTVSILFWGIGLIPDFAALRDRTKSTFGRYAYGLVAMGWRGSTKHWYRFEQAYYMLAGLSTPLVLSVHSIVSFDFAYSNVPGWHVTLFPPYFVAGAVFAGFAMVLTFLIPMRKWFNLQDFVTMKHIDWMCKILLATGLIVFYGYICEIFFGLYSGNEYEIFMTKSRLFGPYRFYYYALIVCNGLIPLVFWSPKARQHFPTILGVCMSVNIGMWLERFIIIPVSLSRDFLPSSWGMYVPTVWDFLMFAGTMGLFLFLMFLFVRYVPLISIFEIRELFYSTKGHKEHHDDSPEPVGGAA